MTRIRKPMTWNDMFGSSYHHLILSITILAAFLPVFMIHFTRLTFDIPGAEKPDRPRLPLDGADYVIKSTWHYIDNICDQLPFDRHDVVNYLKQRYWCDRQRYFQRGSRNNHLNPTKERWSILNPELDLKVDYNRYIVSGPGLGVIIDNQIVRGHTRLPPEIEQAAAYTGKQYTCAVRSVCWFQIQSFDKEGRPIDHNAARFKARLYGPAIVNADVVNIGNGLYNVTYTPYDEGLYLIQVELVSVQGEGNSPDFMNNGAPFLVNDLIYHSDHTLRVIKDESSGAEPEIGLCTTADTDQGRWVYIDHECQKPYCTIAPGVTLSDLQINDPLGLNLNYVWVPADCYYHLYSPLEFHQCTQQCGYSNFSITGDSLGREMLQNLQMILTDFSPNFAMPKLKLGGPHWSNSIKFRELTEFDVNFVMNDYQIYHDVAVLHLHNAHQLTDGKGVSQLLQANFDTIDEFAKNCTQNPRQKCFYYVNPAVQREADHVNGERLTKSFYRDVTRDRMQALNAPLRDYAKSKNLSIIEGEILTRPRWQACWDGIHYSEMFAHFEHGDSRWFGGTSMMITQMFINAICNQPCYGRQLP